jgi:hypothetical protein
MLMEAMIVEWRLVQKLASKYLVYLEMKEIFLGVTQGVPGRGTDGSGQVILWASGEQYSLILSYRYDCHCGGSPFG